MTTSSPAARKGVRPVPPVTVEAPEGPHRAGTDLGPARRDCRPGWTTSRPADAPEQYGSRSPDAPARPPDRAGRGPRARRPARRPGAVRAQHAAVDPRTARRPTGGP